MTDPITISRAQAAIENGLIEALQSQAQADMDGTTVIVSRQACDEAAEFLPALYDEVKRLRAEARQWCGHTYTVDGRAALVMAFETAARQWREIYCLASPGSDEEFHAILSGFDTAVGMFRAALKGNEE